MVSRKPLLRTPLLTLLSVAAGGLLVVSGCQSPGQIAAPCSVNAIEGTPGEQARRFFTLAGDAAEQGDPRSPDYYYQAAILSWPFLRSGDGAALTPAEAWQIYHASVAGLITEGQRHGRFDRRGQLIVNLPGARTAIPIACLDLPWQSSDIGKIVVVDPEADSKLENYHSCPGLGVPVVAVRESGSCPSAMEPFFAKQLPFAATVVLRPGRAMRTGDCVLELYNPLAVCSLEVDRQTVAMARDISAPFDYQLQTTEGTGMLGFLKPDVPEDAEGLRFVEPYQAGKIPIVFIHGLLSDPSTWFDTANDLREQAWFNERYQIWAFRYASGKPFVTSAMFLRTQLRQAVTTLDPQETDPALRQMVLVGHSMGGLVSKLQVTESEDRIWGSFASAPFESLRAPEQLRARLAESCYFEPQPFVRRVIFLATPHGGSSFATRGIGRLGSAMVRPAEATTELHEQLVEANREIFSPQFERRVPTSMDMLEPDDPTLLAIRAMRVSPRVHLHSIIGTGGTMLGEGPGDGVVTVESALHPGVVTQRFVNATHTEVQRHPDSLAEIRSILQAHLTESNVGVAAASDGTRLRQSDRPAPRGDEANRIGKTR